MSWLMGDAVAVGSAAPMATVLRRYVLRRCAVARTRTALGWLSNPGAGLREARAAQLSTGVGITVHRLGRTRLRM